jgi:hypothetical protein
MTSYPETLTVKELIKMGVFILKIHHISSSNGKTGKWRWQTAVAKQQ